MGRTIRPLFTASCFAGMGRALSACAQVYWMDWLVLLCRPVGFEDSSDFGC